MERVGEEEGKEVGVEATRKPGREGRVVVVVVEGYVGSEFEEG